MDNLEYLKSLEPLNFNTIKDEFSGLDNRSKIKIEIRKVKALEIIAEELIKINETLNRD